MYLKYTSPIILVIICVVIVWGFSTGSIIGDTKAISHHTLNTKLLQQHTGTTFSLAQIQRINGSISSSPKESFDIRKKYIGSANGHLDMWMYDITYNRAKLELVRRAESRLPMRLILEDDKYSSFGDSVLGAKALLEDVGVKVLSDSELGLGTNFVHAKTFVTPHRALIQTANLTDGGFNKSREYYIYLTDTGVVANIQALFDADWKGKPLKASEIHPNLLVCPINCRHKIQQLISGAQSSIIIQNQYIEDENIRSLLKTKQQQGISVTAIVANNDFSGATIKQLGSQSIWVVTNPYPHAKVLLIDDTYLMVSSINLSSNSMDNNREIGIIVTNRDAINYFKQRFTQDQLKSINKKTSTKAGKR